MNTYPRPVTQLHQLEPTTRCNLRCVYCPQALGTPKGSGFPRAREDMTMETFNQVMDLLKYYVKQGTQGELAFTGIGEPTLHPELPQMMEQARKILGFGRPLVMSTNGLTFTEEIAKALEPLRVKVYVSLHRPEKAGPAIEIARRYGLFENSNNGFATSSFNWAGQVKWHVSHDRTPCSYLYEGWGTVLVDGRVSTCCLDADGSGVVGHVTDDPATLAMKPFKLCQTCSFAVPKLSDVPLTYVGRAA